MKYFTSLIFILATYGIGASIHAQELEISLELQQAAGQDLACIEFEETFEVTLTNISDRQIRLPNPNSSEQLGALSFTVFDKQTGETFTVDRKALKEVDIRIVELAPGQSISLFPGFAFDRWGPTRWNNLPAPNLDRNLEISAELHLKPNGCRQQYWTGRVKSQSKSFRFNFARAQLPQQYLWNGFPGAGLRILKDSPDLVNKRDEDGRTPLHVAARFNHEEVVQWLVSNGAEVDVQAYNQFTPLYMAHMSANPKIFQMLLEAGADANLPNAFGKSPLQVVVDRLTRQPDPEHKENIKWNRILDVFISNGIELDLISAIQLDKLQLVKKMLTKDPEQLDRYTSNQRPLRTAAQHGRLEIAKFLIESFPTQIDVDNFAGGTGYPVSKLALKHTEVLRLLIDHGADLERRITWQGFRSGVWLIGDNATLLHFAANDGNPGTIKLLLDHDIDPFATARSDLDEEGQTALEVATLFGMAENFLAILEHPAVSKADQTLKLSSLKKCLTMICRGGHSTQSPNSRVVILDAILAHGVEGLAEDDFSKLIQLATQNIGPSTQVDHNLKSLVQLLKDAGGELDFFSAVAIQDTQAIDQMLADNPNACEARRVDGYPAIHFAVQRGNLDLVKKLMDSGCDIELKNHSKNRGHFGGRMLHAAAFWNQPEIAKYLIQSGAEVNVIAKLKTTPLHVAARVGNAEITSLLLNNGAVVDAADIRGRTPLDLTNSPAIKKLINDWIEQNASD